MYIPVSHTNGRSIKNTNGVVVNRLVGKGIKRASSIKIKNMKKMFIGGGGYYVQVVMYSQSSMLWEILCMVLLLIIKLRGNNCSIPTLIIIK